MCLAGSSDFPRLLAAVLPGASNHSLDSVFRHPSNAGPVLLAHVVVDLDNAWIQSILPVLLAPGDPISDFSLRIKIVAFETGRVARLENLFAVIQRSA